MSSIIKGISAIGTAFNLYSMFKKAKGVVPDGYNRLYEAGDYTKVIKEEDLDAYEKVHGKNAIGHGDWKDLMRRQKAQQDKKDDASRSYSGYTSSITPTLVARDEHPLPTDVSPSPTTWRNQLKNKMGQGKKHFTDWLNAEPVRNETDEVSVEAEKPPLTTPIIKPKQSYIEYTDYHYGDGYAASVGIPNMTNDELREDIENIMDANRKNMEDNPAEKMNYDKRNARLQQMLAKLPNYNDEEEDDEYE